MHLTQLPSRSNLNNVLEKYKCSPNPTRNKARNETAPGELHYWEVRPLTDDMIESAALDVSELFELKHKMLLDLNTKKQSISTMVSKCQKAINEFRSMIEYGLHEVPEDKVGLVIGKRGSNKIKIQNKANVIIASYREGCFLILGKHENSILKAKAMIDNKIGIPPKKEIYIQGNTHHQANSTKSPSNLSLALKVDTIDVKLVIRKLKSKALPIDETNKLWDDVTHIIENSLKLYSHIEVNQIRQASEHSKSLSEDRRLLAQTPKYRVNKQTKNDYSINEYHEDDGISLGSY